MRFECVKESSGYERTFIFGPFVLHRGGARCGVLKGDHVCYLVACSRNETAAIPAAATTVTTTTFTVTPRLPPLQWRGCVGLCVHCLYRLPPFGSP